MITRTRKTSVITAIGDGTAIVELTRGLKAIIDESDIWIVAPYKWYAKPAGKTYYAVRSHRNNSGDFRGIPMHRDIAALAAWDGSTSIDHIDLNGLNNRRSNLRLANHTVQKLNQTTRKDNTSTVPGIHLRPWGEWQARVAVGKKRISLGHYKSFGEAKRVQDAARKVIDILLTEVVPSLDKKQPESK